jgi:hypothetical protein
MTSTLLAMSSPTSCDMRSGCPPAPRRSIVKFLSGACPQGMCDAQDEELELLLDLFRENPEDFWRSNKGQRLTFGLDMAPHKITQRRSAWAAPLISRRPRGVQTFLVGTMLAQIEPATKVMSAAHQGMCDAQAEELELLLELVQGKPRGLLAQQQGLRD